MGHEINNPLMIALGNLSQISRMIKNDPLEHSKVDSKIEVIQLALKRIQKITEGMRIYSRMDNESKENISIQKAISSTLDLVTSIFKSQNIDLSTDIPSHQDFLITANPGRLEQILMNLLMNARDATEGKPERSIKVRLQQTGISEVLLSVSDNGSGIPSQLIHKILEPFFTTKGAQKGTGIGLGIVREFVNQFGGRLEIKTEINQGSTFEVFLPFTEMVSAVDRSEKVIETSDVFANKKPASFHGQVLVVDDEAEIQKLLGETIASLGFHVDHADDGITALEMIKANHYDLIFTDLRMKNMNGDELILAASKLDHFKTMFFIVSGAAESINIEEFKEAKEFIAGVHSKPLDLNKIYEDISNILSKRAA